MSSGLLGLIMGVNMTTVVMSHKKITALLNEDMKRLLKGFRVRSDFHKIISLFSNAKITTVMMQVNELRCIAAN
jgi:hypothetical protein